jgi:hypothetical protein
MFSSGDRRDKFRWCNSIIIHYRSSKHDQHDLRWSFGYKCDVYMIIYTCIIYLSLYIYLNIYIHIYICKYYWLMFSSGDCRDKFRWCNSIIIHYRSSKHDQHDLRWSFGYKCDVYMIIYTCIIYLSLYIYLNIYIYIYKHIYIHIYTHNI